MRQTISDNQKITKQDDGNFLYENDYKVVIDKEEAKKNMKFLEDNLRTLKTALKKSSVKKQLNEKEKYMLLQLKVAKEAVKNYNKYEKELIEEIKKDKENRIKQFQMYIDNFNEIKKTNLDKLKIQLENQFNRYKVQLDMDTKHYKLYKNAGLTVDDDENKQDK